jgi:2-polyprenyl-3-methyl-5-hydroxy-6-metoxy-1,4-benzoquinol methylase
MPENVTYCPLCGSPRQKLFDRRKFKEHPVINQLCLNCGLVFQSPRMSPTELDSFYQQEYRLLYQGSQGPSPKDLAVQRGRAQALLRLAQGNVNHISRHLDIGCSAGLLLQAFSRAYGCLPVGVEPGDAYREYAVGQGITVYPSIETLQEAGEGRFDLVSLAHVLEHLANPVEYLTDLRSRWLTQGGYLLVEVPNLYCHDSFEVAHLVSYSPMTLTQTLQQAGYRVLHLWTHGRPRSRLLPLYTTVLASPQAESQLRQVQPEHWVEIKRTYGLLHRNLLSRLFPHQAWLPASQGAES